MTNRILPPGNVMTHFNEKTAQDVTIYGQTPMSRNRLVRVYGDFIAANTSGNKDKIIKIENPNARYDWNPTKYVKFFWDAHTLTSYLSGSDVHEWVDSKSNVMLSATARFPRFSDNPIHGIGTTKPWCLDFKTVGSQCYLNSVTAPPIGSSDNGPISIYFVGRYWTTDSVVCPVFKIMNETDEGFFAVSRYGPTQFRLGVKCLGGSYKYATISTGFDITFKPCIFCWTKQTDALQCKGYAKQIGVDGIFSGTILLDSGKISIPLSNARLYNIANYSTYFPYYFMSGLLVYGEHHSSEDVSAVMSFLEAKYNI